MTNTNTNGFWQISASRCINAQAVYIDATSGNTKLQDAEENEMRQILSYQILGD
jgi:hypothetical protein